jgi:hypothetical protein
VNEGKSKSETMVNDARSRAATIMGDAQRILSDARNKGNQDSGKNS